MQKCKNAKKLILTVLALSSQLPMISALAHNLRGNAMAPVNEYLNGLGLTDKQLRELPKVLNAAKLKLLVFEIETYLHLNSTQKKADFILKIKDAADKARASICYLECPNWSTITNGSNTYQYDGNELVLFMSAFQTILNKFEPSQGPDQVTHSELKSEIDQFIALMLKQIDKKGPILPETAAAFIEATADQYAEVFSFIPRARQIREKLINFAINFFTIEPRQE